MGQLKQGLKSNPGAKKWKGAARGDYKAAGANVQQSTLPKYEAGFKGAGKRGKKHGMDY